MTNIEQFQYALWNDDKRVRCRYAAEAGKWERGVAKVLMIVDEG